MVDSLGVVRLGVDGGSYAGVLAKGEVYIGDSLYLVKSGIYKKPNFSSLEPVIECLVSDILELLGVCHVSYSLAYCYIESELSSVPRKSLVSVCSSFLGEGDEIFHASQVLGVRNIRVTYDELVDAFKGFTLDINNMLVVDYIINNVDRHLRNFALVSNVNSGKVRFAPLYDHGFSLGQDIDIEYLEEVGVDEAYDFCDYAKCCGLTNSAQLSNVSFHTVNIDVSLDEIYAIVDRYKSYLNENTYLFIREILKWRFKGVRELFSKVQGTYVRRN